MRQWTSKILATALLITVTCGTASAEDADDTAAVEFLRAHKQEFEKAHEGIALEIRQNNPWVSNFAFTDSERGLLVTSDEMEITGKYYCNYFFAYDLIKYDKQMKFFVKVYLPDNMAIDRYFSRTGCESGKIREF